MTTITWTSSLSGSWATASNWSPAQVPGSADDALIDVGAFYTITVETVPSRSIPLP